MIFFANCKIDEKQFNYNCTIEHNGTVDSNFA